MTSPDVIAVGEVMVDVHAPAAAKGGHVVGQIRLHAGGSAPNAAVWAAAAGAQAAVVGRVGDDFAGRALRAELEARSIDARLAVDPDLPTGCVLGLGERILGERGANTRLDPSDVPTALAAGAVLVSGYVLLHQDSEAAALTALERARSAWIAVDGASARLIERYGRDRFLRATAAATVLLVNADEALALTGEDPERAVEALADRYRLVCVKRGAGGAVASLDGTLLRTNPPGITLADESGAGDAFAGGLLAALASGRPIEVAFEEATRAGAEAASSHGPWPSRPTT